MKFGKWTVAVASLAICGLSTTAQAAKIFTFTGTIDPSQYGSGNLSFPVSAMDGGFRMTWGLTAQFSAPVSGSMGASGECTYCWYILDRKTHQLLDNNDGGVSMQYDFNNATSAKTTARIQPSDLPYYFVDYSEGHPTYHTAITGVSAYNTQVWMNLDTTSMTSPVQFTLSGFKGVPEPATWALMILGFGGIGTALRRQKPRAWSAA